MKQFYILLMTLFLIPQLSQGQIYGNTTYDGDLNFTANYVVGFKIETGPSDSGTFTHIGFRNKPGPNDCDIKIGLYDHNAASNKPGNLLASEYIAAPADGSFNEHPFSSPPALLPNTSYWIAIRTNCSYGSNRLSGSNWALLPVHFMSRNFGSTWPDPYTGTSSYLGQLAALYAVGNGMVLPVEVLDFSVQLESERPLLKWVVANESNNEGWFVQRSVNGFTWETIDWVEGRGNAQEEATYNYTDRHLVYNRVFYRLEQVDFDGTKSYSEVKSIHIEPTNIQIFPNPVENILFIEGSDIGESYMIYSETATVIKNGSISKEGKIDVSGLSPGYYLLNLKDINVTQRFFKI